MNGVFRSQPGEDGERVGIRCGVGEIDCQHQRTHLTEHWRHASNNTMAKQVFGGYTYDP